MQHLKDERGMALVIVLLTITVFSVLGLAVVGASVNNVKQVKKTEDVIHTVDIAEMGVEYYNSMLKDFFHEQIAIQKNEIKSALEADFANNIAITDTRIELYEKELGQKLLEAYNASFPTAGSTFRKDVDLPTKSYFQINNNVATLTCPTCNTTDTEEQLVLTYESNGFTNGHPEKKITSTFVFTFSINKNEIKEVPIPIQNHDYTTLIRKPTDVLSCSEDEAGDGKTGRAIFDGLRCSYDELVTIDKPSEIKGSHLVFENGVYFKKQLNNGITGESILWIKGNTTLDKQVNGIHDSEIYIEGETTIGTVNQGIHKSTIVIVGNTTFGTQQDKLKKLDESSIYIIGNADMTNIDFTHFESTAKICVKGTITGGSNLSNYQIYSEGNNKVDFDNFCSLGEIENGGKTIQITDKFMGWSEDIEPIVNYN